jgi:myo-inositol 2-dehydrogenase/D-chiro-inositol 1-dehydrogenase
MFWGDAAIKGVIIASSTDMHLEHSLAAIGAGKAALCEKPIDLDLAKARKAATAFEGKPFILGFNRRFDPHVTALRKKIAEGAIGELETLTLINHDPAAPPAAFIPRSGGLFKDFTIHDLDLAYCLLGEPPVEIFATASCLVDPEIARLGDVDTARVVLRTKSNKLCVISNTRRSGYGYDQRVEAYGSKGMAMTGNERARRRRSVERGRCARFRDTAKLPCPVTCPLTRARWTILPTCWPGGANRRWDTPRG